MPTEPAEHGTSDFLRSTIEFSAAIRPERPGTYVRISEDPWGLERGIDRQQDDCNQKRVQLGWGAFARVYVENDTSAHKKKRVTLPDGSVVLRVVRPEFAHMLRDLEDGLIDGVVVYDQDRLLRAPRDLEDLIDICEQKHFPITGVSGSIDLLTSNGRAMARVMAAMAAKSSEDTARRVARAAVEDARNGKLVRGGPRRYGWDIDGVTLVPSEANMIRELAERVISGEPITALALDLQARKVPTVSGANWSRTTVNNVLRSPRIAGIRGYQGEYGRPKSKVNEWWQRAVRIKGEYVMGPWEPVMAPDEWEALQNALDGARARGVKHAEKGERPASRKYLLSGLCYCGAASCGARMTGRTVRGIAAYGCKPRDMGGCNKVSRNAAKLDKLVLELTEVYLRKQAVSGKRSSVRPAVGHDRQIADLEDRKVRLRAAYAEQRLEDADFYPLLAELSARIRDARQERVELAQIQNRPPRKTMLEELSSNTVSIARKRTILSYVIEKVIIKPSSRGPHFTPADIDIVWREAE